MRKRLLRGIARLCIQWYRRIILVFFILLGVAFVLTGSLRFDPNFLKLFPAEEGPIKLYMENLKEAGTFDLLFILLEQREGMDLQPLAESGEKIAEALKTLEIDGRKAFKNIRFQKIEAEDLEGAKPTLTLFLTHPYLFLDEEDIPKLKEKWNEAEIAKQIRKNKKILVSQTSFAMKDLIQIDPFEMRWLFMEKWRKGMKGMEFDESSNLFLSKDQKSLLIITEPARPATDLSFSSSLMEALKKSIVPTHSDQENRVRVSMTGAHPIATAEAKTLRFDMQSSFFFSLILVLILFFCAYRRWITFLFVGLPLFGGIQLTMGIASLTLGSLNILTSAFAAILVGLGIDFAVHIYDRYQQERTSGADIPTAIETTLTQTGEAIWTGAFTTIFAFAILFFSRVQGIVELAFLVSVGLLCALLCIYFVLPSFLIWIDRKKKPYSYCPLKTFPFKNTSSFLEKHPIPIFIGFIGVTLFFVFFAFQIETERDFRNLRPKQIQSLEVLDRMTKTFGGKKLEVITLHEGKELQSLLLKEEELVTMLERYEKDQKVDSFTSLSKFIPSPEKQRKMAQAIRESIDLERVRRSFIQSLKENGFELNEFQPLIQGLEELNRGSEKIYPPETLVAYLQKGPLKKGIESFLVKKGENYKLISHLYYQKGRLSLDRLEQDLQGVSITGPERVESEILRIVREDLFLLTPIAFLIIFFWVFLHFRKWRTTLFTLMPLVMGLTWMVGSMSLFGIRINFVNAVILPMIIGMGIDNSIHLMHRYLERGKRDAGHALRTTGRAMVMCSLTTMLGFGSLVTARYQALSMMGWVTILGMGFCLITALCFLPTLLILSKRKHDEQ
ncbi:MAG: MMPL family transporter [Thermodesulfobacteriota bacterium]